VRGYRNRRKSPDAFGLVKKPVLDHTTYKDEYKKI
jgi:hypothetical protein